MFVGFRTISTIHKSLSELTELLSLPIIPIVTSILLGVAYDNTTPTKYCLHC